MTAYQRGLSLRENVTKFESLHYARGAAALMVVVFHALVNSKQQGIGLAGVDVFFVLSGFLMWSIGRTDTPSNFILKRALRIVPLYWLATFLLFSAAELGFTGRVRPDFGHLFSSLFFLPYETTYGVYPLLQVGWTLNYEVAFYLVFAATLPFNRQAEAITFLFGLLALLHPWANGTFAEFFTNPIILEFVAGIWLARCFHRLPSSLFLGSTLLAVGVVYALLPDTSYSLPGRALSAFAIVSGGLIVERSGRLPKIPALSILGDASYSIYLFHLFAVGALFDYQLGASLLFLASLTAGFAAYLCLERHLLRVTKLVRQRQTEPEPA